MRKIFNRIAYGITAILLAAAFAGCATGPTIDSTVGTWTYSASDIDFTGAYILNKDGSYSVTINNHPNAETGSWALGEGSENIGSLILDAIAASTITFTKANGGKYNGKINGGVMTIDGMEYTKQ